MLMKINELEIIIIIINIYIDNINQLNQTAIAK